MPVQLVQLSSIIPNMIWRVFITRTPRGKQSEVNAIICSVFVFVFEDYAELNAPPTVNLGVVYPQAIIIFTIGLTYSVIMPLTLIFTTIYFGMSYLVYKYKLLNVYVRSYESRGQAWPITFSRIAFGLIMCGLF